VGPKEYEVGSEGIDQLREKVKATTKALISWQNDQTNAVENEDEAERVSGKKKKRGVNRTIYKNPPATDPKGGGKDKVDLSILLFNKSKKRQSRRTSPRVRRSKAKTRHT
jgi:hypothetical protein